MGNTPIEFYQLNGPSFSLRYNPLPETMKVDENQYYFHQTRNYQIIIFRIIIKKRQSQSSMRTLKRRAVLQQRAVLIDGFGLVISSEFISYDHMCMEKQAYFLVEDTICASIPYIQYLIFAYSPFFMSSGKRKAIKTQFMPYLDRKFKEKTPSMVYLNGPQKFLFLEQPHQNSQNNFQWSICNDRLKIDDFILGYCQDEGKFYPRSIVHMFIRQSFNMLQQRFYFWTLYGEGRVVSNNGQYFGPQTDGLESSPWRQQFFNAPSLFFKSLLLLKFQS